jgi:hypothetical protein
VTERGVAAPPCESGDRHAEGRALALERIAQTLPAAMLTQLADHRARGTLAAWLAREEQKVREAGLLPEHQGLALASALWVRLIGEVRGTLVDLARRERARVHGPPKECFPQ